MINNLFNTLQNINNHKPIILCLTNSVTKDFVANTLLSAGASPIMSSSIDEAEEMVNIAHALYINLGTPNESFINLAKVAATLAKEKNKPIILDPVGSGASKLRTQNSWDFFQYSNIIRGNSNEIMSLVNSSFTNSTGVDAGIDISSNLISKAQNLLQKYPHKIIAISGDIDHIITASEHITLSYGSPLMEKVTGMGCSLTAVIAAFAAVSNPPYTMATVQAMLYFSLAGSITAEKYNTPAYFKMNFLDTLFLKDKTQFLNFYKEG